MVKSCMSNSHGFVIVLQSKSESKSEYGMTKKGTYVEIIDFNNLPKGLLRTTPKADNKAAIPKHCQREHR